MDLLGKTFHHSEHEISIASQADFDNLHNLRREFLFPLVEILLPCSVLLPLPKKRGFNSLVQSSPEIISYIQERVNGDRGWNALGKIGQDFLVLSGRVNLRLVGQAY